MGQDCLDVVVDLERRHAANDLLGAQRTSEITRNRASRPEHLLGVQAAKLVFVTRIREPGFEQVVELVMVAMPGKTAPDGARDQQVALDLTPFPDHELELGSFGVKILRVGAAEAIGIVTIEDTEAFGGLAVVAGSLFDHLSKQFGRAIRLSPP